MTGGTVSAPLAGGSLGALINAGLMGADGSAGIPVAGVARAYVAAVEGAARGEIVRP